MFDAPTEVTGEMHMGRHVPYPTSHPDSVAGNSQAGQILRHLQTIGPITSSDALTRYGCARLAARIADLKNKGYRIQSRTIKTENGKRIAVYILLDK